MPLLSPGNVVTEGAFSFADDDDEVGTGGALPVVRATQLSGPQCFVRVGTPISPGREEASKSMSLCQTPRNFRLAHSCIDRHLKEASTPGVAMVCEYFEEMESKMFFNECEYD